MTETPFKPLRISFADQKLFDERYQFCNGPSQCKPGASKPFAKWRGLVTKVGYKLR